MSVTAVPLHPIKKGSILRYWIGVAILVIAGLGLAYWGTSSVREEFGGYTTTASGLKYKVIKAGEGPSPTDNDVVLVKYTGTLKDGTVFDQNPQAAMPVNGVVPGFSEALKLMQRGGQYRIMIPSELGYGAEDKRDPQTGEVTLPGGSDLIFDVDMLEFKSRAEVEAMQKQLQEMRTKEGAGGADASQGLPPELQQQIQQQIQQQQQSQ